MKARWIGAGASMVPSPSRVVTCLEQALQLDPGHVGANLEMAKLLHKTGANDRATAYLQRVLQRAPESQEARRLLADL